MTKKPRKPRILKRVDFYSDYQLGIACEQHLVDYQQILLRLAFKLREEHNYVLGDFDVVSIKLSDDLPSGKFEVVEKRHSAWMQTVELGYDNIDRTGHTHDEIHDYVTDLLIRGCVHVAEHYGVPTTPLFEVGKALKTYREETTIQFKSRFADTKEYRIEPFFKIKSLGCQLFLRVIEKSSNRVGECFYMEGHPMDMYGVTQKLQVKEGIISSKPTKNLWASSTMYLSRGYGLPQKSLSKIDFQ